MSKPAKSPSAASIQEEAPLIIKSIRCVNPIAINATVRESIEVSKTTAISFHPMGVLVVTPTATKIVPFSNLRDITLA